MEVVVYGRSVPPCPYCDNLKVYLEETQVEYEYKDISEEEIFEEFMQHRLRTVPAIFVDGEHKGGFTEAKNIFEGE